MTCAHSELKNSEIWVLKRIFGPKGEEVTEGWRKLHNEELHNLSFLPSTIRMIKSRRIRLAEQVARIGEGHTHRILVGNPKGKRSRLVDNINTDHRDRMGVVCTELIWLRIGTSGGALVNKVMNLRVP
jgi:hypothetical protein